jgi:hypothetical protein
MDFRCLLMPHSSVFIAHLSPKLPRDAAEVLLTLLRVGITPVLEHVGTVEHESVRRTRNMFL